MRKEDIRCLNIINIAFAQVDNDCIVWNPKRCEESLKRIRNIHPEIRILLSVGGWGADGFSQAAMTEAGREKMGKSAAALTVKYDLDGIDIDWEYPGSSLAGIQSCYEDKKNFTLLLKKIRESLDVIDSEKMLTIAAGGDTYFTMQTDMEEVARYVDYVQLMTYDLQGGFQRVTGHHAALYPGRNNLIDSCVDKAVRVFGEAGLPEDKMVVGVPFHSRKWEGVRNGGDGLGQEADTIGGYGPDYGSLAEYVDRNGYRRYWDKEAKVPYLFDGNVFISYEDTESLTEKIAYIKKKRLGGIMFWEYKCDSTRTLLPFIKREMGR